MVNYFAYRIIHPPMRLIVIPHENVRQKSRDKELHSHKQAKNPDERPEPIPDSHLQNYLLHVLVFPIPSARVRVAPIPTRYAAE